MAAGGAHGAPQRHPGAHGAPKSKNSKNRHSQKRKLRAGRRQEFASDGDLQAMGVCGLRLQKMFTLPSSTAKAYGSLQAMRVCRRRELAGEDRLLPGERPSASKTSLGETCLGEQRLGEQRLGEQRLGEQRLGERRVWVNSVSG